MTFLKLFIVMVGLAFFLVLSGCGDSKQKTEVQPNNQPDNSRFQSFTNNLEQAHTEFVVGYVFTLTKLQDTIKFGADKGYDVQLQGADYYKWLYDGMNDYSTNITQKCVANAQNAADFINKSEPDFQYFYTHYKELPPGFRDEFYKMKDILNMNLIFTKSLYPPTQEAFEKGTLDKDNLQEWFDDTKQVEGLYRDIKLEIERIQK